MSCLLALPRPSLPADFEAYEPKISEEISREDGVIRGKKTAEYLVIPRNAGQRVIEPISFSYFDLEKNSYGTIRSPKFEISITPGKDVGSSVTIAGKSDIRLLGEDIRFLKLSLGQLQRVGESPFAVASLVVALVFPPILFLGVFVYRKRQEKLSGNLGQLRFEKAGKEASKRLKHAKKLFSRGDTESYHAEISRALMGYLEDKLHISRASLTLDRAIVLLQQRGVAAETAQDIQLCIERADFARFAPEADTQQARSELLDAAANVINNLERSFSRQR